VSAPSKAYVCGRLISGTTVSNPTEGLDVYLLCLLCVVGSSLCDELITLSEEPYRACVCLCVYVCLNVCDLKTSIMRRSRFDLNCRVTEKILCPGQVSIVIKLRDRLLGN
jgi:hypothetical protein